MAKLTTNKEVNSISWWCGFYAGLAGGIVASIILVGLLIANDYWKWI